MSDNYYPKPGDKVIRPRRIRRRHLRRVLDVPALFSAGYGDVGSSIYYALGVIALVALGATPIALAIAAIIYVFNALAYAEGSSMIPEAGGSASFARHAFNDAVGFIAGWALMLSYIVTMSISAYTIPPYLSHFWPAMREPEIGTAVSMGIILLLMGINIFGVRESSRVNILFIGIDIATQLTLIILGLFLILVPNPGILFQHMFGAGNWPSTPNLILGIAIAALCFTGVETVSQLAEETRQPTKRVPQTYIWMIITVLVLFAGISIVALSAITPQMLGDPINGWARDPLAGIAANLPSPTLQAIFAPLVAILAATILFTATNAGLMGISRLAYNLSSHRQLPVFMSKVHSRFRTPHIAITLFCIVAILVLTPGFFIADFFADLGALYVFGSLLCFALAHASVIRLRVIRPEITRPFKTRGNIWVRGKEIPVTGVIGLAATVGIWVIILITQPFSRWLGFAWMAVGFVIYYFYRRRENIPLTFKTEGYEETFNLPPAG